MIFSKINFTNTCRSPIFIKSAQKITGKNTCIEYSLSVFFIRSKKIQEFKIRSFMYCPNYNNSKSFKICPSFVEFPSDGKIKNFRYDYTCQSHNNYWFTKRKLKRLFRLSNYSLLLCLCCCQDHIIFLLGFSSPNKVLLNSRSISIDPVYCRKCHAHWDLIHHQKKIFWHLFWMTILK